MSELSPEEVMEEKELVFIEEYLSREGDADAALIACTKANIREIHFPIDVTARRVLDRLMPAIRLARRHFQKLPPTEVTKESIITDLQSIYSKAMLISDLSSANANRKLVAQLTGHLTESITVHHTHDVKLMTDDELVKIASKPMKTIEGHAREIPTLGIGTPDDPA